jgi:dihydropteroate synthase
VTAVPAEPAVHDLDARGHVLATGSRCLVMGVVNVTPDSFSDGGLYLDPAAAVRHGLQLAAEGADLLDVGGESTRPGARYTDAATELARVLPVVEALGREAGVPVSVDTRKAVVARAALDAGAAMINDVSAGRDDPELLGVVAEAGVPLVLMHMLGTPATMQDAPSYRDVVAEVEAFLAARCAAAEAAGIAGSQLVVDPGIGFGKRDEHNYALLGELARFSRLGHPVLVGVSRKGFIGRALGAPTDQRLEGTEAAVVWAVERGARIVRVHDVAPIRRIVRMTEALVRGARAAARGSAGDPCRRGPRRRPPRRPLRACLWTAGGTHRPLVSCLATRGPWSGHGGWVDDH